MVLWRKELFQLWMSKWILKQVLQYNSFTTVYYYLYYNDIHLEASTKIRPHCTRHLYSHKIRDSPCPKRTHHLNRQNRLRIRGETEGQSSEVSCPRSHSRSMEEPGTEPSLPESQSSALSTSSCFLFYLAGAAAVGKTWVRGRQCGNNLSRVVLCLQAKGQI